MPTNVLVTLDIGNYLCEATVQSFQAAADRWGVAFVRIQQPLLADGRAVHHFWQKALIPFAPSIVDTFQRVLFLDGDMLVRSDCPNPFDLVPPENMGLVSRCQPRHWCRGEPQRDMLRWSRLLNLPLPTHDLYANGGFMLYSPQAHAECLKAWWNAGRLVRWHRRGRPEQSSLSVLVHAMGVPVTWLPWHFDTVAIGHGRVPWNPRVMKSYIYHFSNHGREGYHRLAGRCRWKI